MEFSSKKLRKPSKKLTPSKQQKSSKRRMFQTALLGLLTLSSQVFAHSLGAHVHGVANVQIAVDEQIMTLFLSSPLDNLIGFEHSPHDETQANTVRSMLKQLRQANQLFITTPSAQCSLQSVKLDSALLKDYINGTADPLQNSKQAKSGGQTKHMAVPPESVEETHADLDAEFAFKCAHASNLHDLKVNLFDHFSLLHQVNAEAASANGQTAAKLTANQRVITW